MQLLVFILIYPLIWLLSILPLRVLHFISDCFYYLLYYVIRYRKNTVVGNLTLAFPEKSDQEIEVISKKFYSHFIDIIIEMIKSFTISKKEIAKLFDFKKGKVIENIIYSEWTLADSIDDIRVLAVRLSDK